MPTGSAPLHQIGTFIATQKCNQTNLHFFGVRMDAFKSGADALFILLGGIMILAMHAGFAFLELGTVRRKNQVNALVKILIDFAVSTIAYFFVGYGIAYGIHFMG